MLLALKLKALAAAAAIAAPVGAATLSAVPGWQGGAREPIPELVELAPAAFRYRVAGDFTRAGRPVPAPAVSARLPQPLAIMKHQVTAAAYQRCVAAGACPATGETRGGNRPAVDVSWWDASAYAAWLTRTTGTKFRLPSDEEWVFAAGSRFRDDALSAIDAADPGRRALARYERETAEGETFGDPLPVGGHGVNENGLLDVAGSVWEWTDSCFVRTALAADGSAAGSTSNCGVRVVEGRHRTYMTDFIRDARAGGCAAGRPPSHLGFRLVREDTALPGTARLTALTRRVAGGV
jgi:formylglycine-generating enzyme required for sulfatase activity